MPKGMIRMDEDLLEQIVGGEYTGSVFVYTVRRGENLRVLAQRFGTTIDVLQDLNTDTESIGPGTRLLIPLKG